MDRKSDRPADPPLSSKALVDRALGQLDDERRHRAAALRRRGLAPGARAPAPSAGTLVAEGDSWFDFPFTDVLKVFERAHGYDVEYMAYGGEQLSAFTLRLDRVLRRGEPLRGVLLSGGGNDIAGAGFALLIDHAGSRRRGLNPGIVDAVIDERLDAACVVLIETVTGVVDALLPAGAARPPILVHGYDYPVPDGRGVGGGGGWLLPGPWLAPALRRKGYDPLGEGRPLLVALIDRFNAMLSRVAARPGFEHVRHVDLRGSLPLQRHRDWWSDELHPSAKGFGRVAGRFAAALEG